MTPEAQALRELARQYAARLRERGFEAVAATGSVARGDAVVGSDIDLWAIGDMDQVFHDSIGGRSVTVFAQTLATAIGLANLSRFDVDALWVMDDPKRVFARIRQGFEKNRSAIFAGIFDATLRETFMCLQRSRWGSPRSQIFYLREAAMRMSGVDVGLRLGLRVPRYRHFQESYKPRVLNHLRDALGIDGCTAAERKRILRGASPYAEALGAYLGNATGKQTLVRVPEASLRRLEAGEVEEALLSLRARFEQQCLLPLNAITPGIDLVDAGIWKLPRPVTRFFEAIHGLAASRRELEQQADSTRSALSAFAKAAGIDRLLSPSAYLNKKA